MDIFHINNVLLWAIAIAVTMGSFGLTEAVVSTPYFPKACVSVTQSRLPSPTYENTVLYGHVFLRLEVAAPYWCARRCLQQRKCLSINYHVPSSTCQLNDARAGQDPGSLVIAQDFIHYDREQIPEYFLGACEGHSCHPEALCQPKDSVNYTCICQDPAYSVNNCSKTLPTDACSDRRDLCENGGQCVEDETGNATCQCPPGLAGDRCQDLVCPHYNRTDRSPNAWTPEVVLEWTNEAGTLVDLLWVHADGREHFAFTVPAAAQRRWHAKVDYIWVARDRETRRILPVENDCSFVVPPDVVKLSPVITST